MTAAGKGAGLGGPGGWFCSLHGNRMRLDPAERFAGSGRRHVISRTPLPRKSFPCGIFSRGSWLAGLCSWKAVMWAPIVDGDCSPPRLAGGLFTSKGMEWALVLLAAVGLCFQLLCELSGLDALYRKHMLRI